MQSAHEHASGERLSQVFRRTFVAALAVVSVLALVYSIYQLRLVAFLLILGGLLAYLLAWPVQKLARIMPRTGAVTVVFIAFVMLLLGLFGSFVPILATQFQELVTSFPDMAARFESAISTWSIGLPGREVRLADYMVNLADMLQERAPGLLANAFNFTQSFVSGTATVVGALFIVPLLTLYFLQDSHRLRRALVAVFEEKLRPDIEIALDAVNRSLGSYIYSRVMLALFVAIATVLVLWLLGVPFSLLLALLAFVGEFIPVVGAWIAFVPAGLIVLISAGPGDFVVVAIAYVAIQLVQNYLIAPRMMGDTMNLHPLTVIIAMMAGATLGGVAGMLVAIPVAAALKVIFGIFVFRRQEKGITVPPLQLVKIEQLESNNDGAPS